MLIAALSAPAALAAKPNILLIITDDQPVADSLENTMSVMPNTTKFFWHGGVAPFGGGGTEFTRGFDTQPLCCPSRASMFSGLYSHNHGITINDGRGFNDKKTWLHRLRKKGYYLGLVGKYLNHVPLILARHSQGGPFDYVAPALNPTECGVPQDQIQDCPTEPWDLERRAETFLNQVPNGKPWALVYATESPHYPWTVAPNPPEAEPTFGNPPSFCETDDLTGYPSYCNGTNNTLKDKIGVVRKRAEIWNHQSFYHTDTQRENGMIPELQATDQALGDFYTYLHQNGLDGGNTLGFYISDNGWLWGQHSIWAKSWPYMPSVNVPFFARWPGHIPGNQVNNDIVANIDIAPTIFAATGIAPKYTVDGQALPVAPFGTSPRQWILTESPTPARNPNGSVDIPAWSSYVSKTRQYIEWERKHGKFVEDYNLTKDPWEMNASNKTAPKIKRKLAHARRCKGARQCP